MTLLAIATSVLLIGCRNFNSQLRVHNDTAETWLVKVDVNYSDVRSAFSVAQVAPGATGVAVQWYGTSDNPVELLDDSCHVVGTFTSQDGVTYTVAGVDGFTATVEPANNGLVRPTDMATFDEGPIQLTSACGGQGPGA